MALTTFSGPVRSLDGFIGATQNQSTGEYTSNFVINSSGDITTLNGSTLLVRQGIATGTLSATTGDSIAQFSQPANTVIKSISILCVTAATVATGDIGFEVGTTSSGAQIVAAITDQILDGGTSVPAGAYYTTTLINDTTPSDSSPAASLLYASAARTIYLNITNTTTPTARGSFKWIIEYTQVA